MKNRVIKALKIARPKLFIKWRADHARVEID